MTATIERLYLTGKTTIIMLMDIQSLEPQQEFQTALTMSTDVIALIQSDTAAAVLPPDTTFAIVLEALERDINESFVSMTVSPTIGLGSIGVQAGIGSDNGVRGRFVGYFSIGGGMFRVHKDKQLLIEEPIANISAAQEQGEYVIRTTTKKFKISSPLSIQTTPGGFESAASGFNGGLNPFFTKLTAGGATIVRTSNLKSFVILGLFLLGMGSFILWGVLQK